MKTAFLIFVLTQLIYAVVCNPEVRLKRDLDMLRMGQTTRSIPPLVRPAYDDIDDDMEEEEDVADMDERQTYAIPRMGKDLEDVSDTYRFARVPPLPRLGATARLQRYLADYRRDANDDQIRQVFVHIPRVGRRIRRSVDDAGEREKRAAPLPRLGYRQVAGDDNKLENSKRAAPLPRLGMYAARAAPLPRLGMRSSNDFGKDDTADGVYWSGDIMYDADSQNNVEAGKDDNADNGEAGEDDNSITADARAAPLPRLGLMTSKKAVGMLRMGRAGKLADKRAMGMLRMGKRGMGMLRMGKRGMGMLRMGRDSEQAKRAVSMLRMGKRPMGMLRMGKRAMGMLRMGKRAMGMLRMGKRSVDTENQATE